MGGGIWPTMPDTVWVAAVDHYRTDSDSDYTFGYIADWNASEDGYETLTRCMDRIQKIARSIIDSATEHLDPGASEQEIGQEVGA